jgi:hypothetical protein
MLEYLIWPLWSQPQAVLVLCIFFLRGENLNAAAQTVICTGTSVPETIGRLFLHSMVTRGHSTAATTRLPFTPPAHLQPIQSFFGSKSNG